MGDIAAVGLLLVRVSALGKLTRNGSGTISDMRITSDNEAQHKWCYRTLPAKRITFTRRKCIGPGPVSGRNIRRLVDFSCLTLAIRIGKFQAMEFASPGRGNRLTIFRANDSCWRSDV